MRGYSLILQESISHGDSLPWAKDTDSIEEMTEKFVSKYLSEFKGALVSNYEYIVWYKSIVTTLEDNEALVFFADYDASHRELLINAPGYNKT